MRAGAQTLTLVGAPRNYLILQALAEGPKGQLDLRRAAGSPAQSTLRGHLKALEGIGAVVRRRRDVFPGALEYALTEPGRELLAVAAHLCLWLESAPAEPLELGSDPGKAAVKGLVDGWLAGMLSPLSDAPLSLTELDKRLSAVSYPTIERRLETMRLAEQVEMKPRTGAGTPYAVTPWLRQGIAPLAAAARWEHRNDAAGTTPVARADIESALTLAAPLLGLDPSLSGLLQIAVRPPTARGKSQRSLGLIEVRGGKVVGLAEIYPQRKPDAWASGTVDGWFTTIIDGERGDLRVSGDRILADALLGQIHSRLFHDDAGVIPAEVR